MITYVSTVVKVVGWKRVVLETTVNGTEVVLMMSRVVVIVLVSIQVVVVVCKSVVVIRSVDTSVYTTVVG